MEPSFSSKLIVFLAGFSGFTAYAAIFGVLLACGLGVPIPEDITLISAGILASLDKISLTGAILIGFAGVMVGDSFLFFMGRIYGYKVFTLPGFRRVFTESRISVARERVLNNEKFICFTARFLPGLRSPIFLTAGVLGVKPSIFLLLDGGAALLSVPAWVVVGWWFGSNIDQALAIAKEVQLYLFTAIILFISGYLYYKVKIKKSKAASTETQLPKV
jgi:membrane protein DedA with SNARE-associated domain